MKKCFAMFLFLSLLLTSLSANSFAVECEEHVWGPDARNTYQYEDSGAYDASGHIYRIYLYETCEVCGKERRTILPGTEAEIRPHNYTIYVGDAGHVMTGVHAYWYKCSSCPHQKALHRTCLGPPCNNAIEKVPHDHNEE